MCPIIHRLPLCLARCLPWLCCPAAVAADQPTSSAAAAALSRLPASSHRSPFEMESLSSGVYHTAIRLKGPSCAVQREKWLFLEEL